MELKMVRGTTKTLRILLKNQDGSERVLADGETLRWGMKSSVSSSNYIVVREMTNADYDDVNHGYNVTIDPSDTEDLVPGRYWFDAGIQSGENSYITVLPLSFIWIDGSVTRRET